MKTRTWIVILCALLAAALGLCVPMLLPSEPAAQAKIWSEGKLVETLSLGVDQEFTITTASGGENTITVRDGAIAVTAASCPDHYCMHRGFCDGGSSIVCLPNSLVIEFTGEQEVDFVVE